MSEIVPTKWLCTADAFRKLLKNDDEWCRLCNSAHSAPDIIKPDAEPSIDDKKRWWIASKGALYSRERSWIDPVHSDVAAEILPVFLLTQTHSGEWIEHQLPAKYLESRELAPALETGQAGKLRLTGPDIKFVNASLYFRSIEWEARLSTSFQSHPPDGNDATAHSPSREGPSFARDETLHLSSPGDGTIKLKAGNRPYNDDEVVAEVKAAVKLGTYKSYRDAALALIDKVKGSGTPESKARRIARKASQRQ